VDHSAAGAINGGVLICEIPPVRAREGTGGT